MACNFIKKETPTQVFSGEHGTFSMFTEEFLRISKGGLTWSDLYDLTNVKV